MKLRTLFFVIVVLLAGTGAAQPTFERVLLPVALRAPINGALGSLWTTTIAITNTAQRDVFIYGYDWAPAGCGITLCEPGPTPPGVTFFPKPLPRNLPGTVFYVDAAAASDVHIALRLQDVSRQADTWGTDVPVIREKDLFRTKFELIDVPLTGGFRQLLRLYNVNVAGTPSAHATVRFYRVDPSLYSLIDPFGPRPPAEQVVFEQPVAFIVESDLGYAEISNISAIPELAGITRVRIEIVPSEPNLLLWGFVSVTNNVTQHVTLVTPR